MTDQQSVAFICCDNGLGHIKRSYLFAQSLANDGYRIDIFAPSEKYRKIEAIYGKHQNISNLDFSTGINKRATSGELEGWRNWTRKLPSMDPYNIVVSDNLLEILEIRQDAIISANFFWNIILDIPEDRYEHYRNILRKNNNLIIGSEIFTPVEIQVYQSFRAIGLLDNRMENYSTNHKDSILFSAGKSGLDQQFYKDVFNNISAKPVLAGYQKISDSHIPLPVDYSPGAFNSAMYDSLLFAFIRPGLGTLNDLLAHDVIPICVVDGKNPELAFNALRVQERGLGLV